VRATASANAICCSRGRNPGTLRASAESAARYSSIEAAPGTGAGAGGIRQSEGDLSILADSDVSVRDRRTARRRGWDRAVARAEPRRFDRRHDHFAFAEKHSDHAAPDFARALGEYGSVIFIAGNIPYVSEIAPLLIVVKLTEYNYAAATAIATIMLLISFALLLAINLLQSWSRRRYSRG
jgi:hypothetical protein